MTDINANQTSQAQARPGFLPEKFWDEATQSPRLEELVRSNIELERRRGQEGGQRPNVPASPDAYAITEHHPMCGCDLEVNKRLHAAGFSNEQAQLVYDLAFERLLPTIHGMAAQMYGQRHEEKLHQHFGGPERFAEVQRQLSAWAKANLPEDVFKAMSSSAEGVMALERMMNSGEPGLNMKGAESGMPANEAELKKMVADPRYWKSRDPAYMAKVTDAFKRAYDSQN
ncbi:MAG: hypothetical protein HQL44_12240 [Alphaproteobacteria bacterium]|nr:hypothetical protein [Alphaproteobacteria bacterium]